MRVALFDLVATLLSHPKVDFVHAWVSQWLSTGTAALDLPTIFDVSPLQASAVMHNASAPPCFVEFASAAR